jgi:hypothetical protein
MPAAPAPRLLPALHLESGPGPDRRRSWRDRLAGAWPPWRASGGAAFSPLPSSLAADGVAAGAGADASDGDGVGPTPETRAGVASRLLFSYADPLVRAGAAKPLDTADLWPVAPADDAGVAASAFGAALEATASAGAPTGSVARGVARAYWRPFAAAGAIKLVHDGIMFLSPWLLRQLLRARAEAGGAGRGRAAWLAVALAVAGAIECLTVNVYFHKLFRVSLHMRAALVATLLDKGLRASPAARGRRGAGAVTNLMSNDAAKLWALPTYMHMLWWGRGGGEGGRGGGARGGGAPTFQPLPPRFPGLRPSKSSPSWPCSSACWASCRRPSRWA